MNRPPVRYPASMFPCRIGPWIVAATLVVSVVPASHAAGRAEVVFCAPGYPGTTEQAAPTMDALASALVEASGGALTAVDASYHQDEAAGVGAIRDGADVAVVTLPFWLAHGEDLGLRVVATGVTDGPGREETWALVAPRGRVRAPSDLAGWELASIAGYAPGFVRGIALGDWGSLPEDVTLTFTSRVLGSLRRAAAGEPVAVLLDGAQDAALDRLPFAGELEIVARSEPVPTSLVCVRGERPEGPAAVAAFRALDATESGRGALEGIRLERVEDAPKAERLDRLRRAYAGAGR